MKNRKIDKMESLKLVCKIYFKNYTMVYIGETSQKLKKKKKNQETWWWTHLRKHKKDTEYEPARNAVKVIGKDGDW